MAEEIAQFESSLAAEREKETERQTKMMDSLAKRKEELLAEAEKRKQVKKAEKYALSLSLSPAKTWLFCLLFCLLLEQEDNITSLPIISGETKSAERPRSISRRHPGAVEPAR